MKQIDWQTLRFLKDDPSAVLGFNSVESCEQWRHPPDPRLVIAPSIERQNGMAVYFDEHYGPNAPNSLEPKMIVLHWTGVPSASSTWNTFASATLGGRRDIRGAGKCKCIVSFLSR